MNAAYPFSTGTLGCCYASVYTMARHPLSHKHYRLACLLLHLTLLWLSAPPSRLQERERQ